ncbi:MAG: 30S ribosomal protein S12 methylthiotransferase RimO [Chloroflexota bacterium]|nr:30S ribosomal protein S12 methylthiotransferase RimO [Chloroflexota bacterium]
MNIKKKTFHLLSLGCAKNTVDSDSMAQLLMNADHQPVASPDEAEIIIVNTCGFIDPAKEESFEVLRNLAAHKKGGQMLIAAGCLTQRYGKQVSQQVDGIDGILGTRRWMDILDVVQLLESGQHPEPVYHIPDVPTVGPDDAGTLRVSINGASAYLKIADGCRRHCAFCAIPLIKGTSVSRPMDAIISDARALSDMGMCEIILIAQDTTDYGHDLGMKNGLAKLLKEMTKTVPEVDWLRVMYAYTGYVTDELIEVMATHKQILPYLDMPLQHAHPDTLERMRRPANMDWVYRTLEKMRAAMPDLSLRTTFIVGYPGETEAEFGTLLDFVEEIRFDHVGVFQFSFEAGTPSEHLGDPIPAEIKQARWHQLMELQQNISLERNQRIVGKTLDVLIEGHGDGISIGRSYRDAPEIDGMVIVEDEIPVGEMPPIHITSAMPYDLTGVVDESMFVDL